jgi:hypothetical protein
MHNCTWRFPLLSSPLADSALLPIAPSSTPLASFYREKGFYWKPFFREKLSEMIMITNLVTTTVASYVWLYVAVVEPEVMLSTML